MENQKAQITAKVLECIKLAEAKYNITMPPVEIRFDLRGRCAGIAGSSRKFGSFNKSYFLRFNVAQMKMGGKTWEHLLNDTVPHEVAHTVCQAFPQFGKNHDAGWVKVCKALGGNGNARYSFDDAPEAIAHLYPFTYTGSKGITVRVPARIHNKIQKGASFTYKNAGIINCNSPVVPTTTLLKESKMTKATTPVTTTATVSTNVPAVKPKTVKTPKAAPVATTSMKVIGVRNGKATKSSQIREFVLLGNSFEHTVEFCTNELKLAKGTAIAYTKHHFTQTGRDFV